MAVFSSNGSFYNFYPNLPKISVIHKMSKNKAFTWNEHLLSEIDHFVILSRLTQNFLQFQNKQNLKLAEWVKLKSTSLKSHKWMLFFFEPTIEAKTISERLIRFPSYVTRFFYFHFFNLKFPSYKNLAMTSQFALIWFYDVIIRNSVFQLGLLTREFQIPYCLGKYLY